MAKVVCNKLKHRVPMGLSRRDVVLPLALPEGGEQLPCCVQEGGLTVAGCTNAALRCSSSGGCLGSTEGGKAFLSRAPYSWEVP